MTNSNSKNKILMNVLAAFFIVLHFISMVLACSEIVVFILFNHWWMDMFSIFSTVITSILFTVMLIVYIIDDWK